MTKKEIQKYQHALQAPVKSIYRRSLDETGGVFKVTLESGLSFIAHVLDTHIVIQPDSKTEMPLFTQLTVQHQAWSPQGPRNTIIDVEPAQNQELCRKALTVPLTDTLWLTEQCPLIDQVITVQDDLQTLISRKKIYQLTLAEIKSYYGLEPKKRHITRHNQKTSHHHRQNQRG